MRDRNDVLAAISKRQGNGVRTSLKLVRLDE
jgi:hypothetical protein